MAKRISSLTEQLPYAQLVLKPGDSRPIVVTLHDMGGSIELSAGPSSDAVEAQVVLHLMAQVVRSIGITRQLKEEHEHNQKLPPSGGDDIPF